MEEKKTRYQYSHDFKRQAVLEVYSGRKADEVLLESGYDLTELMKKDKKYAAKLIHKWKREFMKNPESLSILNVEKLTDECLLKEISYLERYEDSDYDKYL